MTLATTSAHPFALRIGAALATPFSVCLGTTRVQPLPLALGAGQRRLLDLRLGTPSRQPHALRVGRPHTQPGRLLLDTGLAVHGAVRLGAARTHPLPLPIQTASHQPILFTTGRALATTWSLAFLVGRALTQTYGRTIPCGAAWSASWSVLSFTPVGNRLRQRWDLASPPVRITRSDATLFHHGLPVPILEAEFSLAEGEMFWTGNVALARLPDYVRITLGDEVTLAAGEGTWSFLVDRQSLDRAQAPRMSLSLVSPAARRATPWATPITRTWETTTPARTATEEAAGLPIRWELVAWEIPPNRLAVHQAEPLQVARRIVEAAGGLLESLPDGTLRARQRFPVRVPDWPHADPDHLLTDTRDLLALSESFVSHRRVDQIVLSSRAASSGHLSLELDARPDGLNQGHTLFHPGDTVFLLVFASSGVTVEGLDASAGSPFPAGIQSWDETTELVFEETTQVQLPRPATALLSTTWHGRSLGALTLDPHDRMTITAPGLGTAVAHVGYRVQAQSYGLILPMELNQEAAGVEEITVTVRANGLETTPGDAILCQRGAGAHPGDPILEPLLDGLPSLLSRGRAEIDSGEPLRNLRLDTHFQATILPGHLIEIQETLTASTWRGKVTSVHHHLTPTHATTSIELLRHVPTPA